MVALKRAGFLMVKWKSCLLGAGGGIIKGEGRRGSPTPLGPVADDTLGQ